MDIKVPVLPESVTSASVATWHKKPGDRILRDEPLVDIETDKVVLEVVAPQDGILEKIVKNTGDAVVAQEVIGLFKAETFKSEGAQPDIASKSEPKSELKPESKSEKPAQPEKKSPASPARQPSASTQSPSIPSMPSMPSPSTPSSSASKLEQSSAKTVFSEPSTPNVSPSMRRRMMAANTQERSIRRVPMSRLRARIAERLVEAQKTAAILTTFNEVNMKPIMDLRSTFKDEFEKVHGVKLGFMSFFTLAVVSALKKFPMLNAVIEGNDIVYHDYYDIAIAVSTPRGLVVPVVRDVEKLNMADIEDQINDLGEKARQGKLTLEEMTGGTFTISNGGVFGSLLSTPILNAPQSGILGMHKIEERPVVENGQIVIKPMMYIALSYDHRLIDGKDSVQFLVAIKEWLENPFRGMLNI